MSQNTENFESLRHLLTLKRHEQPPPGYFNSFSSQVIARIKLGETGEERANSGRGIWEASWLQRLWAAFETKPILAGGFAVAVCGLLIGGMVYTENVPATESAPNLVEVANAMAVMPVANHPLLVKSSALETPSTSPIMADGLLLGGLHADRATFSFPGGN
jgi:hypothetical protein